MKIDDENKDLLLLISLSRSLKHLKDALFYDKECTIALDEIQTTIKSNELSKVEDLKIDSNNEGLSVSR